MGFDGSIYLLNTLPIAAALLWEVSKEVRGRLKGQKGGRPGARG